MFSLHVCAKVWPLLPPQAMWSSTTISTKRPIPFGTPDGLTEEIAINIADLPSDLSTLEHVTVTVSSTCFLLEFCKMTVTIFPGNNKAQLAWCPGDISDESKWYTIPAGNCSVA